MRSKIALLSLVIVLGLVNWSIAGKERHLAEGRTVYLELAPVDPRSLMQGDYMALRFGLADQVRNALPYDRNGADGHVVATLDERKVGSFKSLHQGEALSQHEILLRYRIRDGAVKFATNAFFFQEGHAKEYERARFGQFRVDGKGELILVAMHDENLKQLGMAVH